jgi:hypothetical protein
VFCLFINLFGKITSHKNKQEMSFKDRSDLRLSARYIFQQMTQQSSSSQPLLTTVQSVKHSLLALFGTEHMKLTKSEIKTLALEEYEKLYGRDENETPEEREMFPAVDEALFVKISERIYLLSQNDKAIGTNFWCNAFFDEVIKTQTQMSLSFSSDIIIKTRKCICRDAFMKCATTNSPGSVLLSSQSASSLWKSLVDCERIVRKEKENDAGGEEFLIRCSLHDEKKQQNVFSAKTVSFAQFPFKRFDPNQQPNQQNSSSNEVPIHCVSKETLDRCFRLNERL